MIQKFVYSLAFVLLPTVFSYAQINSSGDCPVFLTATATRMNVLYVGVDNVIQLSGLPADSLEVSISTGTITQKPLTKDMYIVRVNAPGEARVIVTFHNTDPQTRRFSFLVKRIPDPTPALGAKYMRSDTIQAGVFKAQMGMAMVLQNFDFDARCSTVGFKVTLIGGSAFHDKGQIQTVYNTGARFKAEAKALISQGEPGDIFIFSDITAECPEDKVQRKLNSLIFFLDDRE